MKCYVVAHPQYRDTLQLFLDQELITELKTAIVGRHPKFPKEVETLAALQEILHAMLLAGAKRYALWRLSKWASSSGKLAAVLLEKGVPRTLCQEVICYLQNLGYLDDAAFAEQLVMKTKRSLSGLHTLKRVFLKEKLDPSLAEELYQSTTTKEEESKAILAFAYKRRGRPKTHQEQQKLIAALMRRGFSYQSIASALSKKEEY